MKHPSHPSANPSNNRSQIPADGQTPALPKALSAREEWLETIFEHTNDGVFVLDLEEEAIVGTNRQASEIVGYGREELAGTSISAIHPSEMPEFSAFLEEILQEGHGWSDEFTCRRKDGRRVPCEISAAPVTADGHTYILAHVRETTDQKHAQRWLEGQNKILEMIGSAAPLDEVLEELCQMIEQLAPGLRACVLVLDRDKERFDRAIGPSFPEAFTAAVVDFSPGPPHAGTCGQAVADGQAVISQDVASDDRWSDDWRDLSLIHDINACRSTPIRASDDAPLGSLFLCFEDADKMDDQVPKVVDVGTHLAGIALERDQSRQALQESKDRLTAKAADMERLHALHARLLQKDDVETALREVMDASAELLGAPKASVQIYDDEEEVLRLVGFLGFDQAFTDPFEVVNPGSNTPCAAALEKREQVLVKDLSADPDYADFYEAAAQQNLRSAFSTPLYSSEDELLGMFTMYWEEPHRPAEDELKLLDLYIQQAARQVERRRAEEQLRQSERRFRRLLGKLPAAAYMCDSEGLITYYNDRAAEVWGRQPELWDPVERFCGSVQMYLTDGTPLEHEDCWTALTLENEREYREEIMIEQPDGSRVTGLVHTMPLRGASGNLEGALTVVLDITERKRAEQELRKSKDQLAKKAADMKRLHALSTRLLRQESVEAALHEVMEASAELLGADKASTQIYDEADDVLRLASVLDFDRKFIDQFQVVNTGSITTCAAALEKREQVLVEDLSTDPDYTEFYRTVRRYDARAAFSTPLYDSNGRLLGMFTMYWNEPRRPSEHELKLLDLYTRQAARYIERRRATEKLRDAKEEAEKTARLRSNLLANVSHEIRTPITGILGLAEGLEEKVAEPRREEVRLIEKSGHRLMDTLESVMALAQLEGGEVEITPELVDVTAKVEEMASSLRPLAAEKGLSMEVISEAPGAQARLDPALLGRILDNLISNAVKFTEEGGVTVKVSASAEDVSIDVSDTGVGISTEFQSRLFKEFTQESTGFSRSHEGIGLGLALTKKMTEQMGGRIEVESEKGQGSTFSVTFPRARSKSPTDGTVGADEVSTNGSSTQATTLVLLIEDNETIRRVITERLEAKGGFEVQAFETAAPALERAEEQRFDVVLIDICLPGMDGIEALRRLRSSKTYRDRPIIAVTGQALPGDRERFLAKGFSAYIGKPFSADQLAEKIRSIPA